MLTYFYVKCDSLIESPLVEVPNHWYGYVVIIQTKRIAEDAVDIHIKRQARNTKLQLVCNSLSLNTTDSHHQLKLNLAASLLLSVQTA